MIIDSHQHFWIYDSVRDAWIDDSMKIIQKDFLPSDLKPILDQNNIDGCMAVQADQSETETEFLFGLANQHNFIKGVVGWVDLRGDRLEERLHHYSQFERLKGFRHIVQGEADDQFLLRKDFLMGIKSLQKFNFTYDILVYARQLPAVLEFVKKFPSQKFVIDHIAKPEIKIQRKDNWEKLIRQIAKQNNVYCKISGMVTEADWNKWKPDDFKFYLDVVFESFGTKRIMYGSDWPVCLVAATYERQLQVVNEYLKSFSNDEQQDVMGVNAMKFYSILN